MIKGYLLVLGVQGFLPTHLIDILDKMHITICLYYILLYNILKVCPIKNKLIKVFIYNLLISYFKVKVTYYKKNLELVQFGLSNFDIYDKNCIKNFLI